MSVVNWIATARDETFAARVAMCLMKAGLDASNEDPGTDNHANRLALAQRHLKAEINSKAVAAAVIASNGTIQGEIDAQPAQHGANVPDGDLQYVVNGLYNMLANAYAANV